MIPGVDQALATLLRHEVLDAAQVEFSLDAPNRDWAARRGGPVVNAFLHGLREDTSRRQQGEILHRDSNGKASTRSRPPRVFRLSYLVTAWAPRPEDEHRLLAAVLSCLCARDVLTIDEAPYRMSVAVPAPDDRSVTDIWSALGGELRPSLDVVVAAPLVPGTAVDVAPLVAEPAVIRLVEK